MDHLYPEKYRGNERSLKLNAKLFGSSAVRGIVVTNAEASLLRVNR
jgi:hypothetical protein